MHIYYIYIILFFLVKHYSSAVSLTEFFVYTKLPESSFKRDLAKDTARFACIFALLTHVEYREFVFDFHVRFLGTAIFFCFGLFYFIHSYLGYFALN